ncbi:MULTISPECIES: fimbrial protein [unclassified Serratia (in: enterobacteria)]|uniref:fimbrial protein n=1 Tax=unclassified Serratia (in: enterobacteria) TaxID=2647522 RepID=UPI00068E6BED|nr:MULTISPECIES: fimbrial protein [unclassified Serratia (in: enterobacteria)]
MIKRMTPLAIIAATLLAPPLWAADGTMKFSGKLTENTCVLDAGSKNQMVALGRKSSYSSGSVVSSADELTIKINNCPASSNQVRIRFEGIDTGKNTFGNGTLFAFSNTGQLGAAGNVGFTINYLTNPPYFTPQELANGESISYDLQAGANDFSFYVGTSTIGAGPITAGNVVGNVQFSVDYP